MFVCQNPQRNKVYGVKRPSGGFYDGMVRIDEYSDYNGLPEYFSICASKRLQCFQSHFRSDPQQEIHYRHILSLVKEEISTLQHTGTVSSTYDSKDLLCASCTSIPFSLLNEWSIEGSRVDMQLRHIHDLDPFCRFCCLVFDVYQRIFLKFYGNFEMEACTTPSIVFLRGDEPWYHITAIKADLPNVPYAWLQFTTRENASELPYICLSSMNQGPRTRTSFEKALSLPRIRSEEESVRGLLNFDLIRSWVKLCDERHSEICTERDSFKRQLLDIKLIDVQSRKIVNDDGSFEYAALSYVCGRRNESTFQNETTSQLDGQDQMAAGDLPLILPKTIEDAIVFTKKLGIRFLWIDQYCINQKDPVEVKRQINMMDLVYECAYLTIVALWGEGIDQGLPGLSRKLRLACQSSIQTRYGKFKTTFIESMWHCQGNWAWDQRMWTLQEGLLSKRCIFLDSTNIFMRCCEEMFHDSMDVDLRQNRTVLDQSNNFFWENGFSLDLRRNKWDFSVYDALVANYTGRRLTDQSDVLNACRGALNQITRNTGVGFVYGMPQLEFNKALLWKSWHKRYIIRREGFPSWSWVGWIGRTEYHYWLDEFDGYKHTIRFRCLPNYDTEDTRQATSKLLIKDAFIYTKDVCEGENGHVLKISSILAPFKGKMVEKGKGSWGPDLWTLLDKSGEPLPNQVGDHMQFQQTAYFFPLNPNLSKELENHGDEFRLLFIKYWPAIRDHHESNNWLFDIVSALVIRRINERSAVRIACVHVRLQDWIAAGPKPGVVELV